MHFLAVTTFNIYGFLTTMQYEYEYEYDKLRPHLLKTTSGLESGDRVGTN